MYTDLKCCHNEGFEDSVEKRLRARQETIFKRFKDFNVCKNVFCDNMSKHKSCIFSIANLLQMGISNESQLFSIE